MANHGYAMQGSRPLIFLCQHRAASVRIAYIPEGSKPTALKQGLQLRVDRKAPIVGMAAHPFRKQEMLLVAGCPCAPEAMQRHMMVAVLPVLQHLYAGAQLMVAFGDGTLSGCTVSGKTLASVWNVPLGECGRVYPLLAQRRPQTLDIVLQLSVIS
jgi:hypothetical protein